MEEVSFAVAFSAGLLSFLSPCVLPLVPVYLASLAGPEILESRVARFRMPLFLHSVSFVLGFSIVFSLWGAGIGLIGSAFVAHSEVIRQVVGSLLIVFGLLMLAALKVPWLNYERRLNLSLGTTTGYLRAFLTGAIFSLAWTPCVGPILGGILTLALDSAEVWQGTYLLAVYSLGLGLPFLVLGAAFDYVSPLLKAVNRYSRWVYMVSGILLMVVGVLILTGRLVWLSSVWG